MADQNKYNAPEGPPPSYPPPVVHHDAGPYYPSASPAPGPMNQVAPYYGPPDGQLQQQQFYGGGPPYAQQPPYPQQPYYANQPPMYYQQPQPQPVQGYFPDQGRPGSSESFCSLGHRFTLIAIGFLAGLIFVGIIVCLIITRAAKHRSRSRSRQQQDHEMPAAADDDDTPAVPGTFGK
ncbi:hypothetical protein DV738_g1014, partial [Chaetothyriales sp. CBS 135597]